MTKVICVGLPRCGGHSLQAALEYLTGKPFVHSAGRRVDEFLARDDIGGVVECWLPPEYIFQHYPHEAKVILNRRVNTRSASRYRDKWFKSCAKLYPISNQFNNPIWTYPLRSFREYADWYESLYLDFDWDKFPKRYAARGRTAPTFLAHDFLERPEGNWDRLRAFLNLPPDHTARGPVQSDPPFPNHDVFRQQPQAENAVPAHIASASGDDNQTDPLGWLA